MSESDVAKYLLDVHLRRCSPRAKLTNEELALCFGGCRGPGFDVLFESPGSSSPVAPILAAAAHHASHQLVELEGAVASLVSNQQTNSDAGEFPLPCPSEASRLFQAIHQELRDSWCSYQATRSEILVPTARARDQFPRILLATSTELDFLEKRLIAAFDVNQPTSSSVDRSILLKFMKLSGVLPAVARSDFTRALYNPSWIVALNPTLTNATHGLVVEGLVLWHRLCVLEDKVLRLCSLSTSSEIASELRVRRCFDAQTFPSWLAFEVEHQIQIRPEQALIAQHLIESPGDIMQLNMGLGKTRVIVPMLLLFWSLDSKKNSHARITRLNVLPNLFHEANDYFRSTLTGSIARIRLFALPFCRDVVLDDQRLASMSALLNQCRESKGFFLVCPEHRLSLELKTVELHRAGRLDTAETLIAHVHDSSMWRELLDESDELLHHRFRLIYATGAVSELPQAVHRYRMPQFLLFKFLSCPNLLEWADRHSDVVIKNGKTPCDSLPSIRINGDLFSEERARELRILLADAILANPPYELDWVQNHPALSQIRSYIVDPEVHDNVTSCLSTDHQHDVLVLRGLLAGGLLAACLQKRHRVDFGINRDGEKRIAIPFRAADVPAARSEFAHPDCAIVLSCLAYYSDGLDAAQLADTFRELLRLGKESKKRQYAAWFELSKSRMGENADRLDLVDKLDLENMSQFEQLVVETINFYLRHLVFPEEMQYFPERMTATSWNLAENDGRQVVGFSGTNDNHRILPRQVRQFFFDQSSTIETPLKRNWLELFGTNGMMVERILEHTLLCRRLSSTQSVSKALLSFVRESRPVVGALIDAGALLAGVENKDFASMLAKELWSMTNDYRGVTFFDPTLNKWSIMEIHSGRTIPTDRSSISVDETFAFFDEPRCRGADLRLRPDTVAVLTLGPKMGKDKLMQGAGRMRNLGNCQKLVLVGTDEVMNQVTTDVNAVTNANLVKEQTKGVLDWALSNSVESNAIGLLPWATQGCFHATSYGDPTLTVEQERASLRELYGSPFVAVPTPSAVDATRRHYENRAAGRPLDAVRLAILDDVSATVNDLGCSVSTSASGLDEECERELVLQREIEVEQEMEVPKMDAVCECDWDLSSVLSRGSVLDLPPEACVVPLRRFVEEYLQPLSLRNIAWPSNVFVTGNFTTTVVDRTSRKPPSSLNSYLRLVDAGLVFPKSGHVLLLSEREADRVVELMYECQIGNLRSDASDTWLFNLSLVRTAADGALPGRNFGPSNQPEAGSSRLAGLLRTTIDWTLQRASGEPAAAPANAPGTRCVETMALSANRPENRAFALPDSVLACLQLFAGETTYATDARKASLKAMLTAAPHDTSSASSSEGAAAAASPAYGEPIHLIDMRGYRQCYPYSDAEKACKEVAREYEAETFPRSALDDGAAEEGIDACTTSEAA